MFIRYHGNYSSTHTNQPYGIFVVLYHLKRDGRLSGQDERLYDETVQWFETHLPNPPFYEDGNQARGVTWFKHNEHYAAMFARLQPFIDLARKYEVALIRSEAAEAPGVVIYEDDYQIGVIPVLHGLTLPG